MNAKDIFTDKQEYDQVKEWCKMCNGTVIKVTDEKDNILFDLTKFYHYDILHTDKEV